MSATPSMAVPTALPAAPKDALVTRRVTGQEGRTDLLKQAKPGVTYVVQMTCVGGAGSASFAVTVGGTKVASGTVACPGQVVDSGFVAKGGETVSVSTDPASGGEVFAQVVPEGSE